MACPGVRRAHALPHTARPDCANKARASATSQPRERWGSVPHHPPRSLPSWLAEWAHGSAFPMTYRIGLLCLARAAPRRPAGRDGNPLSLRLPRLSFHFAKPLVPYLLLGEGSDRMPTSYCSGEDEMSFNNNITSYNNNHNSHGLSL